MTTPTPESVKALADGLTRGQKQMLTGRHTEAGNPWPFISITQRAGGAKNRMFEKLFAAGLYAPGNVLTPLGLAVRAHIGASHD